MQSTEQQLVRKAGERVGATSRPVPGGGFPAHAVAIDCAADGRNPQ